MKTRFELQQIIGFLHKANSGLAIKDLSRNHGFVAARHYQWRTKFGDMDVFDAKRLKARITENA